MWNMERIGLTASEEMSFENVDGRRTDGRTDGRTPDACIYYKLTYEPSAQVMLKTPKNIFPTVVKDYLPCLFKLSFKHKICICVC